MKEGPSNETVYLREKLYALRDVFQYLAAPRDDSYLMRRQKGEWEGMAENRYKPGTDDIASRLGLYTAASFSADHPAKKISYDPKHIDYS